MSNPVAYQRPAGPDRRFTTARGSGRAQAMLQLILAAVLVVGIAMAATVASVGFARAQGATVLAEPDTKLVIAMLACAVVLMAALSVLAVRFTGRQR